ncbi:hypothetical protein MBLNU230_g2849t1 [Neophaeotheca triangularis]
MADTAVAKDVAAKERIIRHMNNDHHDSILRYLQHYCQLSSWTAFDSHMTDVDLSAMKFACSGKTYSIPFEPPLGSMREIRERVVAMDQDCHAALGTSPVTVNEYVPPTVSSFYMAEFSIVVATFIINGQRRLFEQGGLVESLLGTAFAKLSWQIAPYVFWGLLGVHGVEVVLFSQSRLAKHGVNIRTPCWWKWAITFLIEGVFGVRRFDDLVQAKKAEREKAKH